MNSRKRAHEKRLKSGYLLLSVFIVCGIIAACGGGGGGNANLSTDNSISGLTVNGIDASGTSPVFTAEVDNEVASAEISFVKPPDATAEARRGATVVGDFNDPADPVCTFEPAFNVGENEYTITITSQSGSNANYYLTVTRLPGVAVPATSIVLNTHTLTININDGPVESPFTYNILPSDASVHAYEQKVVWSSSEPTIAVVNPSSGTITPLTGGLTNIVATVNDGSGVSDTAILTVESDSSLSNLMVNGILAEGALGNYKADVANDVPNATITFTKPSAASAVFRQSSGAETTFSAGITSCTSPSVTLKEGDNYYTIIITPVTGKAGMYVLTVTKAPQGAIAVTSINLIPGEAFSLPAGDVRTLTTDILPRNATNQNVSWTTDKPLVAAVEQKSPATAEVTALSRGTATITATTLDGTQLKGTVDITVLSKDNTLTAAGITIPNTPVTEESPDNFSASVATGVAQSNITFTKPLGSTAVFTVGTGGASTPFNNKEQASCPVTNAPFDTIGGPNLFTITITSEHNSPKTYYLTVNRASASAVMVSSVSLSPKPQATINLVTGTAQASPFVLTVLPAEPTNGTVTWTSSDTTVATVNPATGAITTIKRGTTNITATANDGSNKSDTAGLNVVSTANNISTLRVNGANVEGTSPSFTATVANAYTHATISFTKPLGAKAEIMSGVTLIEEFDNLETTSCSKSSIALNAPGVGTAFTINIYSENNPSAAVPYYLTVTREEIESGTLEITINWVPEQPLIAGGTITLSQSGAGYPTFATITLLGGVGPFTWYVDGVQEGTGTSFTFNTAGITVKPGGQTYNITVKNGQNNSGDVVKVTVLP